MTVPPRVKVCGITRAADAERAVSLGAAAIGFVFWPASPRAISLDDARAIARALPPFVVRVGVFVNALPEDVERAVTAVGLDAAQLHGDETVDAYSRVPARLLKVVTAHDDQAIEDALALPLVVTPLIDAMDRQRRGGTGRLAEWRGAAAISSRRPVILAGGLTAANVGDAVRAVQPWAVDVSSGVESAPGIKDSGKLAAFFAAVSASAAMAADREGA